ncbi:MAG: putative pre-16S rRNA nuclease [Pyrinomonadaceae bacterium]|nr:MAG: putative pre-16S rRNA nuclease [Pyrinomonadaceae bacterium]
MQERELILKKLPQSGRILSLDIGLKHVGVAVCDELRISVKPLVTLQRGSWKKLLKDTMKLIEEYNVVALVLGLPLNLDGTENEMTSHVKRLYRNYSLSLKIPVFLQDERLTSYEAERLLKAKGYSIREINRHRDQVAAAIILEDFLSRLRAYGFAS